MPFQHRLYYPHVDPTSPEGKHLPCTRAPIGIVRRSHPGVASTSENRTFSSFSVAWPDEDRDIVDGSKACNMACRRCLCIRTARASVVGAIQHTIQPSVSCHQELDHIDQKWYFPTREMILLKRTPESANHHHVRQVETWSQEADEHQQHSIHWAASYA